MHKAGAAVLVKSAVAKTVIATGGLMSVHPFLAATGIALPIVVGSLTYGYVTLPKQLAPKISAQVADQVISNGDLRRAMTRLVVVTAIDAAEPRGTD